MCTVLADLQTQEDIYVTNTQEEKIQKFCLVFTARVNNGKRVLNKEEKRGFPRLIGLLRN